MRLPIEDLVPGIRRVLRENTSLVLQAPPGAGKTTRVPLALLDEPWLNGSRIIMLEPRRLAARTAAAWMAALRGEEIGKTIGYRMRMETRVGPRTRVEVVTEGVLTRMLQQDPSLEHVALLIFDEFHERSLHADLGLALALHARSVLRPDLRILVMSATLDTANIAGLLEGAETLTTPGIAYPVETRYLDTPRHARTENAVANAVHLALHENAGDMLAFLPGAAEIARTASRLADTLTDPQIDVLPLYANLTREEQQRAIVPSTSGRRKVVLATSIAETSLTIEGVRAVVDSGWMRVPRFSPRTGMTRLETIRVTRDSADQRRGRAGRTAPGVCYRLWSIQEEAGFVAKRAPEILEADLAPLALELATWGIRQPTELKWLDAPPDAAYSQASELLSELRALDGLGRITEHGRKLAELPAHPRIAHMLSRARALDALPLACDLAALLEERDPLRQPPDARDPDIRLRLDILNSGQSASPRNATADRGALAAVRAQSREWRRRLRVSNEASASVDPGLLIAFAYPDRIARRRERSRDSYLLRNGRGARVPAGALLGAEWIVAAQLGGSGRESTVWLGASIEETDLHRHFADQIKSESDVTWDANAQAVRARRRDRLGAITWNEGPLAQLDPEQIAATLLEGVRSAGLGVLPWNKDALQMRQRLVFLHTLDPAWPDASEAALLGSLVTWLLPQLHGKNSVAELRDADLAAALSKLLSPQQRSKVDTLAPSHFTVPTGSRIAIDYSDPAAPTLAVRLQEVFGMRDTPRLGGGAVPLTLQLLSPAMRPVQVTRDLASFWRAGYFDVRKDLRARYPRHSWPDDPLTAEPTRRTRRKTGG